MLKKIGLPEKIYYLLNAFLLSNLIFTTYFLIELNRADAAVSHSLLVANYLLICLTVLGFIGSYVLMRTELSKIRNELQNFLSQDSATQLAANSLIQSAEKTITSSEIHNVTIKEVESSISEISTMVQHSSEYSQTAKNSALEAKVCAQQGMEAIEMLLQNMNEVDRSSKKVEEIMELIDDISFQTKILALTASIEAARAGEHGLGFGVVAEAVKTLASKSSASAAEINQLIKNNYNIIQEGRLNTDKTNQAMTAILGAIEKVAELNNTIAEDSIEQSIGIEQITSTMSKLESSSQDAKAVSTEAMLFAQNSKLKNSKSTDFDNLKTILFGMKTTKTKKAS